jgi:hypothetical protein
MDMSGMQSSNTAFHLVRTERNYKPGASQATVTTMGTHSSCVLSSSEINSFCITQNDVDRSPESAHTRFDSFRVHCDRCEQQQLRAAGRSASNPDKIHSQTNARGRLAVPGTHVARMPPACRTRFGGVMSDRELQPACGPLGASSRSARKPALMR